MSSFSPHGEQNSRRSTCGTDGHRIQVSGVLQGRAVHGEVREPGDVGEPLLAGDLNTEHHLCTHASSGLAISHPGRLRAIPEQEQSTHRAWMYSLACGSLPATRPPRLLQQEITWPLGQARVLLP